MPLFITFEGPEGSGKSTQARLLRDGLQQRGCSAILTREPGGTGVGEKIRNILLDLSNSEILPVTEALLYVASRAQLVEEVLRPALAEYDAVLCDRYADSTLAYQGFGCGLDTTSLRLVNDFATGGLWPDLTFYLDLPVEEGLERKRRVPQASLHRGVETDGEDEVEWTRFEAKEIEFHRRVRDGYLRLASEEPERWVTVDARLPAEILQQVILARTLQALSRDGGS